MFTRILSRTAAPILQAKSKQIYIFSRSKGVKLLQSFLESIVCCLPLQDPTLTELHEKGDCFTHLTSGFTVVQVRFKWERWSFTRCLNAQQIYVEEQNIQIQLTKGNKCWNDKGISRSHGGSLGRQWSAGKFSHSLKVIDWKLIE